MSSTSSCPPGRRAATVASSPSHFPPWASAKIRSKRPARRVTSRTSPVTSLTGGRPAVPRGERRGRTTSRTPLVPPVRRPAGLALAIQPTSVTPSHLWLLMPNVYDRICLVTTIYLVQHGDKERLPGDPGLTELGKRQAALTARWLRGKGLKALYSSPLRRVRETAEPVGAATGLAVRLDSRLRERLNWDGTQAFDAFLAEWDRSTEDRDLVLGNGESSRSAGERLR